MKHPSPYAPHRRTPSSPKHATDDASLSTYLFTPSVSRTRSFIPYTGHEYFRDTEIVYECHLPLLHAASARGDTAEVSRMLSLAATTDATAWWKHEHRVRGKIAVTTNKKGNDNADEDRVFGTQSAYAVGAEAGISGATDDAEWAVAPPSAPLAVDAVAPSSKWTALIEAANNGHSAVLQLLLDKGGADVNRASDEGGENSVTPLLVASKRGYEAAVRVLLQHEATDVEDKAFLSAVKKGHVDVVRLFLEKRERGGSTLSDGAAVEGGVLRIFSVVRIFDSKCGLGHHHTASLSDGPDKHKDPLFIASDRGRAEIVRMLISLGTCNVNRMVPATGATPIVVASHKGHIDVVRILLEVGADANQVMTDGSSALLMAADQGFPDVVRLLLEHGADAGKATETGGNFPLYAATQRGDVGTMALLLEPSGGGGGGGGDSGDGDTINSGGNESRGGKGEGEGEGEGNDDSEGGGGSDVGSGRVSRTSNNTVRVDQTTKQGTTSLWIAARKGYLQAVKLLASFGADAKTHNKAGFSALWIASQEGHIDVVRYLVEEHGCVADEAMSDGASPMYVATSSEKEGKKERVEGTPFFSAVCCHRG